MRKLNVQLRFSPTQAISVGQLAEVNRKIYFEYDDEFLRRDLHLSPFKLRPRPGLIEHVDRVFGPLPGLIDDSLPDGWGLLLVDRLLRKRRMDPNTISPLERLSYIGTRAMGALTYHPPEEAEQSKRLLNLHELGKNAQQIYGGEAVDVLPELARAGGSPGGARPKVLVGVKGDQIISGEDDLPSGFENWIVKFSSKADARDAGPMEFAYALMAKKAGIAMPETRLFSAGKNSRYFGVRRFDRGPENARMHVHTFGNLLHIDFRIPSTDYADLMKVTIALTRNYQDSLRIFQQMAFNVAAHNRDDHAKNFAFVMNEFGEWSCSPAYDLVFARGPGGEHSMSIMGEGRTPTREHLLDLGKQFDIKLKDTREIIEQVNSAVADWPKFAKEGGCTKKTTREIAAQMQSL